MTIEDLRAYARIDDDEIDAQVEAFRDAGVAFIEKAVGEYDDESALMNVLLGAVVGQLYDNRQAYVTNSMQKKLSSMFHSIIMQLQLDLESDTEA